MLFSLMDLLDLANADLSHFVIYYGVSRRKQFDYADLDRYYGGDWDEFAKRNRGVMTATVNRIAIMDDMRIDIYLQYTGEIIDDYE